MQSSAFSFGESGSDQLFNRRLGPEPPEFDITAMVDLVFMMNIYFLVTFVTVAMSEMSLPTAKHVAALDPDTAVIFSVTRTLDGKSINLYVGDGAKSDPITDPAQQEKRVQEVVEQAFATVQVDFDRSADGQWRVANLTVLKKPQMNQAGQ